MITIKTIEDKIQDKSSLKVIEDAYKYALKEHKGMKRLTGDDFITHPLEVANILADLNVDAITIEAALLHETINNGNSTYEDLESNFGIDVAKIVDSVSKINKLELPDDSESSKIYFRKILVGMSEDVRVLYIKLADRLHNMRTNWAINPDKQKQKAKETMDVLIPIAHRLGINSIKSELEDLCLYYLKPDVYNDILEKLNTTVDELNDSLENMKQSLIQILTENNIKFEIKGRVKSVYSIYNKLNNGKKWNDIYDILALRIFVTDVSDCYTTVGLIHSKFRPVPNRFKDYIAQPKENMYQSLHTTVFGEDGKVFEVQIRTYEMDEIAEKGIASHWSYKEKGAKKIQNIMEQKLEMYRNIIETSENGNFEETNNTLEDEMLADLIYVYTPKGDVMELPKGSTPIDFAYRIHTKVGDTTVGALVNDNIVPFSYELQDGDIIKIKTNPSGTPNKDWLSFVKTREAASKIKSYFSKKDHEEYVLKGKAILDKELKKRKIGFNEIFTSDALKKIIKDLKLNDEDDLYLSLGTLRYTAGFIINLVNDDKANVIDALIDKKKREIKVNYKGDIYVDGISNVLINMAKCCKPVKGDDIVGYITKGEGITVHKRNCPNIVDNKERIIDVSWNMESTNEYYANLYVHTSITENILTKIIEVATKKNVYVQAFNTIDSKDETIYELTIKIKDKEELESMQNSLMNITHVKDVTKTLEYL